MAIFCKIFVRVAQALRTDTSHWPCFTAGSFMFCMRIFTTSGSDLTEAAVPPLQSVGGDGCRWRGGALWCHQHIMCRIMVQLEDMDAGGRGEHHGAATAVLLEEMDADGGEGA